MKAVELVRKLRHRRPRILVVGDVMVDGYWFGDAERISPEAPVPVVEMHREEYRPGGAANVAVILRSLGATVDLVGVVGKDDDADRLVAQLEAAGISTAGLLPTDRPTVRKIRVIVRNQQLARLDWEDPSPLPAPVFETMLERVGELARKADGVIFQDYAKGVFTPERIPLFMEACGDRPVLVDPKPVHMEAFRGVRLLKPNRAEYAAWGRFPFTEQGLSRARKELGVAYLLVTLGPEGMVLVKEDELVWIPSTRHEVFDVTGAGDAVLAGFSYALLCGASPEESALFATFLAGREVMHLGVAPIPWEEVEKEAMDHGERLVEGIRRMKSAGSLA